MEDQPTIAVLLATYNGAKYLKQQLDSILSQTYQNFKIYISDDYSDDHTLKIIQEYQQKYPTKIFYTINEKNIGFVKNFEKLLKRAIEEYIAFSDQDDIWLENKLEFQMQEMLKLEKEYENVACMVHSDLDIIDEEGKIKRESYFQYRSYKLKLSKDLGHILGPCGVMGNTMLFNHKLKKIVLPFPNQLDTHDYWLAVNNEFFGVRKTINKSLVKYRIHKTNANNSQNSLQKKQFNLLNRNLKLPNLETNRKFFLPQLLNNIDSFKDREILEAYMNYLNFNGNKLKIYLDLLRFSFLKRDVFIKIKIFLKLLLTNKYKSKV